MRIYTSRSTYETSEKPQAVSTLFIWRPRLWWYFTRPISLRGKSAVEDVVPSEIDEKKMKTWMWDEPLTARD
jgi:hypothetical protein